MKIIKNDKVFIVSGKDKGKTGKVTNVLPASNKIVVEGMNIRKKHSRPKKQGQKGQIIQMASPMNASKAKVVCKSCDKPTRIGYQVGKTRKEKVRICKKCKAQI